MSCISICSQRAERSEAVRSHVRSRITQQDQRDPEGTPGPCQIPPPLTLDTQNKITWDVPQHQRPTGGESVITSCKIYSPPL